MAFSGGAGYDPWIRAWDINTHQQIWATAKARDENANVAAFSPNGRILAIGFTPGSVKVFDGVTGSRQHMLVLGTGVESIAFSPDGSILAAALENGNIRLFDTKSWCETKQIGEPELTESIAFSPDGSLLAAARFEKVCLWSVSSGEELKTFEVQQGPPPKIFADEMERRAGLWRMAWRVAFSPDGKVLATGSSAAVQLWDVATGDEIKSSPSYGEVGSLYFSPDGQWVVWGQNEIIKWNPRSGKRLHIKNEVSMGATAMTPDGKLILSPGVRSDIAIYDFQTRRKVGVLTCAKQQHHGPR